MNAMVHVELLSQAAYGMAYSRLTLTGKLGRLRLSFDKDFDARCSHHPISLIRT